MRYQPHKVLLKDDNDDEDDDGDDLEEGLRDHIPRLAGTKPRSTDNTAWSYGSAQGALTCIEQRSKFRWDGFELGVKKKQRARGATEKLLAEGYLSKQELVQRDQALGIFFIRRITKSLFTYGMNDETVSIDVLVQYALAVVLQAVLNVRAGDIMAPTREAQWEDKTKPCLTYGDVILVLGETNVTNIKGQWTVRNSKGSR